MPGALTWDPVPAGGSMSTARGGINPSADSANNALLALVSPDRITTWSNRAALVAAGLTTAFFTDVGVGGSYWDYLGGRWRPQARRVTIKNLTTDISNNGAPKVVMDYATIPAGLLQDGDILECRMVRERTGGTSDTDALDVMLGAAPTTLGTSLNLTTSALATTTLSLSLLYRWRRVSATSLRAMSIPGALGIGSGNAALALISGLTDMDANTTYLQATSDLTTAAGEVAWLRGFQVDIISGG